MMNIAEVNEHIFDEINETSANLNTPAQIQHNLPVGLIT